MPTLRHFVAFMLMVLGLSHCSAPPQFGAWELPARSQFNEKPDHFLVTNTRCSDTPVGIVFYPGGLVHPGAYIPLAAALAEQCHRVIIAKMPLDLAVFDADLGNKLQAQYAEQSTHWIIGGHSLGGAMAAQLVGKPSAFEGLFLLAAYPANDNSLEAQTIPILSVSADQDGLATPAKIEASRALLPASTKYVIIHGGNHAQFGDYGPQKDDGIAQISGTEQLAQTHAALADFITTRITPSRQ